MANTDLVLNVISLLAGASAFGALAVGIPKSVLQAGAATVAFLAVVQILCKLGNAAAAHADWQKRWNAIRTEIRLKPVATQDNVARWLRERAAIEDECVGELRALCIACENEAAHVLQISNRQREIKWWQRLLIHFGTLQAEFPFIPDDRAGTRLSDSSPQQPAPSLPAS